MCSDLLKPKEAKCISLFEIKKKSEHTLTFSKIFTSLPEPAKVLGAESLEKIFYHSDKSSCLCQTIAFRTLRPLLRH